MPLDRMIEYIDQRGKRFEVDTALEVVVTGRGLGYIEGNSHTHPGRFHVYYPHLGYDLSTSVYEIESMSEESRCWLAGFLAGQEPGLEDYLGTSWLDEPPNETDAEWDRWHDFTKRFREAGWSPQLGNRPISPLVITDEERAEMQIAEPWTPWALAGERVWVPEGDMWVEADPQPDLVDGELAGTVCADRGHPDLMQLASGWLICLDCAEVSPY